MRFIEFYSHLRPRKLMLALAAFILVAAGCVPSTVSFPHIHGLAFSSDGTQLIVPAHDGFRLYSEAAGWQDPAELPRRDYMGYSPVDSGFYSSGHPAPGSQDINPLGLVHSDDMGVSVTKLGLEGESDFHVMAVGYYNHAIYVLNPGPNSRMQAGIHYSMDDGATWTQSALNGLMAQPYQLAVHPSEPNILAAATPSGVYFSTDFADNFSLISASAQVASVAFSPAGDALFFALTDITRYDLSTEETLPVNSPPVQSGDAILYLAVGPADSSHLAAATSTNDIFLSTDGGASWQQIADNGRGL